MKEMNLTDEMITAFHCGSLAAFHQLYCAHYRPLYQFTTQLLQDKPEAGYIVMDTFMKLLNRRTHFYNAPDIRAFLYITARNTSLDLLRSARSTPVDTENDHLRPHLCEEGDRPDEESIAFATSVLHAAIAALPAPQHEVFCLVFERGIPVPSAAKQLNMNVAEVFAHRKNAIGFLQNALYQHSIPSDCLLIYFLGIGCRVAEPVHIVATCKG